MLKFTDFENELLSKVSKRNLAVALPETENCERVIESAKYCQKNNIARIVTINNSSLAQEIGAENFDIVQDDRLERYAQELFLWRKHKGMTIEQAREQVKDPFYYCAFLQKDGLVDCVVGGAVTSTAKVLMPAFHVVGSVGKRVSSCFILQGEKNFGDNGLMLVGDCAVNILPDSETLCEIAEHCLNTSNKVLGLEPRIAFLSYSTSSSAGGTQVDVIKKAVELFKQKHPEISCDGEVQADAALDEKTAQLKIDNTQNNGKSNILIFPDLQSGNIGYKLMRYAGNLNAYGPIVQGTKKPFCDLSRSSGVKEIILTIAICVLLCENC